MGAAISSCRSTRCVQGSAGVSRWCRASTAAAARLRHLPVTGRRIGFIAATSCNFCAACNRVRITATGRLETCLGHEGGIDLRAPLRLDPTGRSLESAIDAAIASKPAGHGFAEAWSRPVTRRGMHVTGG